MKYFNYAEFDSPDLPGSGVEMQGNFLSMLDEARGIAGIPFKITSGYRTEARNKKVGGVPSSAHVKGLAADIACTDSTKRMMIVRALLEVGFTRIGIADTFIHVDNDISKLC